MEEECLVCSDLGLRWRHRTLIGKGSRVKAYSLSLEKRDLGRWL